MGFANIAANNGWSMAILGAGIVMTGLIILTLAISQIHKLVEFWENRKRKASLKMSQALAPDQAVDKSASSPLSAQGPIDLDALASLYQPLTNLLGSPFELKELYRLAAESNLAHPHITIRCLREAGILTMEGQGLFSWNR